jgi:hypothetical protein
MSLVFPTQEAKVVTDKPRTHALVIGVGEYLHLPGGRLYETRRAKHTLGLKQLTSPPISAKEFAHWLIAYLKNRSAPLGSVELVLSPAVAWTPPNDMMPVPVEAAMFENIKKAFDRWDDRCNADPGNIGLFYFCGHGFQWPKIRLLASDFGADPKTPWENAIDIDTTWLAVKLDGRARAVCFFLDACRDVPFDPQQYPGFSSRALKDAEYTGRGVADLPVLVPAVFGGQAHAPPSGHVSYFTQALIRCLDGLGASSPYDGRIWKVNTDSLSWAMQTCMARTKVLDDQRGVCENRGPSSRRTDLHELSGTPRVMTTIGYDPPAALEFANLSLISAAGRPVPPRLPSAPEPWETEAEAGDYKAAATFPNKEYPDRSRSVRIGPPYFLCEFYKDYPE